MKKRTSKKIEKTPPTKKTKVGKRRNKTESYVKIKKNEGKTLGGELEAFLREHIIYETIDEKKLKFAKSGISKIIKKYFPSSRYQTFVETFSFENEFHSLIGFRGLNENKFSFINCGIRPDGFKE